MYVVQPSFSQKWVASACLHTYITTNDAECRESRRVSRTADSRHAVAEPGVGQLVDDDIDEGAVAGQKSCIHLVSACVARRRANVLGVKKERQAFSCESELNQSYDASAVSTHHPAVRERRRQDQQVIHSEPVRADDILLFGQESGRARRCTL